MRENPHLYEINARVFLKRISQKYKKNFTLAAIPDKEWQALAGMGFDLVWLMGVWQTSDASRQKAIAEPSLRSHFKDILPDWKSEDISGSPYAVYAYDLNSVLGRPRELSDLKTKLNRLGLKLILDFVPNHLALDHPWTASHPDWFVRAAPQVASRFPHYFFQTPEGNFLAHGRDPYFPAWTDTVQNNLFYVEMRSALIEELLKIAGVCDGVRCDMAMLALDSVFEGIWGNFVKSPKPPQEFWQEAIGRVRTKLPDFIFIAEAYWNHEWNLQQLGFDFTYDKIFYDRLKDAQVPALKSHLQADAAFQKRCVRFLENHDELRAAAVFEKEKLPAALVSLGTLPGLRFYHDGQLEGRRIRIPVQLLREPVEPKNTEIFKLHEHILKISNDPVFHEGQWLLLDPVPAWSGNWTHQNFLAWMWTLGRQLRIVAVNLSAKRSQARLMLPFPAEGPKSITLYDPWCDETYLRDQHDLVHQGLYIDREPWGVHIFKGTWEI